MGKIAELFENVNIDLVRWHPAEYLVQFCRREHYIALATRWSPLQCCMRLTING